MSPSVFFYVQHLLGVGHVYRATRIAKALCDAGFDVHLIWGGTRIPEIEPDGIDVRHLTSVRTSDNSFSELLHENGDPFTDNDKQMRCEQLLSWFDEIKPDILITEAFPFGRRQMRFELLPLLERVEKTSKKPMVASSIRDIMQEGRKEKRVQESTELVEKYFDLILVHGDEKIARIEETLQGVSEFSEKIHYTGLVTPEPSQANVDENYKCDVLVTVGGGAFGQNLTHVALDAMQFSKAFPSNWLVSAGSELPEDQFEALQSKCPDGMRIVRYIPNLAGVMKHTSVSVSHTGYNTVADVLRAGCRAVFYPHTGGGETEQLRRSEIMRNHGIAEMVLPEELNPENLALTIDRASKLSPAKTAWNLDGAKGTAEVLMSQFDAFRS